MGFSNRKGIAMAGGFKLQAEVPLDVRNRVDTIAERDELVTINAAWEGMHVYVTNTKKTYEYKGNKTWEEVITGSKYIHPKYTKRSNGLYKITVDDTGHVSDVSSVTKSDITALGIPGANTDTTYTLVTATDPGLMSSADKVKLDGIAKNANNFTYTHPSYTPKTSGLYKIVVDDTGHVSDTAAVTKSDITALGIPGSNTDTTYDNFKGATSENNGTNGLVPAPYSGNQAQFLRGDATWATPPDTTYGIATTSKDGLMSTADKTKLDGIATNANKYNHPTYTAKSSGLYKVTVDGTGHVSATTAVTKSDITALGIPGQDTTYTVGTESYSGTTKLYTKIGSAIDGTLTQKAIYDNYTGKSTKVNATLPASGWSGTTSPYTNTITISGVTATNNVEVLIPSTITAAQAESWMAAGILCGSQDTDSITLKAYGDKPSIDIPIECIIRKDI